MSPKASGSPAVEPGRRRAHRARLQPRPRLLQRARRDQARPGALLRVGRRRHRAGAAGAAVHAAPVPGRRRRREGAPEAAAARSPDWVETVQIFFPAGRAPPTSLCVTEPRRRRLGGADVDRRVPPVEHPPRRHRAPRRVAHRPRPDARLRLRDRAAGRPRRPRGARRASASSATPRPAAAAGCTSTCASSRAGGSPTCAGRPSRSLTRSSAGCPTW
nr:hypothetical protein [Angustibacter aerolatus]